MSGRNVPVRLMQQQRPSFDDFSDQLLGMLDDVERRVENFRESASLLENEKEELLDALNHIHLNSEMLRMGSGERDDLAATTNRLLARCKAVDVAVSTPRSDEQQRALGQVSNLIQGAVDKLDQDLSSARETIRRFLNACSPDQPEGPIDQRFQAAIIGCTADDQKKASDSVSQRQLASAGPSQTGSTGGPIRASAPSLLPGSKTRA